jgi:hypothetical protein
LQLYSGHRLGPIHYRSHHPGIHLYTPCSDVTQKGDGGVMEFALLCFYKKLVLQEALENMSDVFFDGAGEDKNVIEVDEDEPVQHY